MNPLYADLGTEIKVAACVAVAGIAAAHTLLLAAALLYGRITGRRPW